MAGRSLRRVLVGGSAAVCLLLPGVAFADGSNAPAAGTLASNAVPLTGAVTGNLAADSAGSYRYAQFNYPGDNSTVTLNLTVDNAVPLETGAAGFNVYQAGNLLGSSTDTSPTTASFSLTSSQAGPVVVQVFDYDPSNGVAFTLTPQGLPPTAAAATPASPSTATPTAANTTATPPRPLGSSATGTLAGNTGGSFALYSLAVAGTGQNTTLTLDASPSVLVTNTSVGFNVYDANGNLVGSGQQTDVSTISLNVTNLAAGTYTVQVFNYDPSTTLDYVLSQVGS